MWRDTNNSVPTLAELRKHSAWTWFYCERCLHHATVAFVPLMIRWGADASSDKLRASTCTVCGHKGATLQHPGWVDANVGLQPFPESVSVCLVLTAPIIRRIKMHKSNWTRLALGNGQAPIENDT